MSLVTIAPLRATEIPFSKHQIGEIYAARVVDAADFDGDGDNDVVAISGYQLPGIWLENDGANPPSFTPRGVGASLGDVLSIADLDGDGDADLLSSLENQNLLAWYENNGEGAFAIHTMPSSIDPEAVHIADINGDGRLDLLTVPGVSWWENDGAVPASFVRRSVGSAGGARAVDAADLDGDGDLDVISAPNGGGERPVVWFENDGAMLPAFAARTVGLPDGLFTNEIRAADFDGDGDADVASASLVGDFTWFENDGSVPPAFTKHPIAHTAMSDPKSMVVADLDADGDIDIQAATRGHYVVWFENSGGGSPTFMLRDAGSGEGPSNVKDVDRDGDLDILSVETYNDYRVTWHENRTIHRSATYPAVQPVATVSLPRSVRTGDIDGDGDPDLVSASEGDDTIAWYENDGAAIPAFTSHAISTSADGAQSVSIADLDDDGDTDVLSASVVDDKIAWYENDGASPPGFALHTITTEADRARAVHQADLDGDGDIDVLSASQLDDTIAWYESDGAAPPAFTLRTISFAADGAYSVDTADLDRDGDLDVISASRNDDKVAWYENDGAAPPGFAPRTVSREATGVRQAFAADLDADGDADIVAACPGANRVIWFESDGAAEPVFAARNLPATAAGVVSARAIDIDADGDLDIAVASSIDDKVAWYENDGAANPQFSLRTISTTADGPVAVDVADLDRDGDLDVLEASQVDGEIAWYPNRGGQFALATSDLAPDAPVSSHDDGVPVLRIDAFHRGRGGDSNIELATFALVFDDGAGTPLSTAQANALVEALQVYADDGDGSFDPAADAHVATVADLSLDAGLQRVPFSDGDARVAIAATAGRAYFVALDIAGSAHASSPASLRVTHVTTDPANATSVQDQSRDIALAQEYGADAGSDTLAPVCLPGTLGFERPRMASSEVAGRRNVQVVRDRACGSVGVDFAVAGGTATPGLDYRNNVAGVLVFADGVARQKFGVNVRDDGLDEANETIEMELLDPTGGAALGTALATMTIRDDDAPPTVGITGPSAAVEGTDVNFTLSLGARSGHDIEVVLGVAGTAERAVDYRIQGTRVVIPAGTTIVTRDLRAGSVDLIEDGIPDAGETIVLSIASVRNATVRPEQASVTVTIADP